MSGGMLFGVTSLLLLLLCISAVASHVLPCPTYMRSPAPHLLCHLTPSVQCRGLACAPRLLCHRTLYPLHVVPWPSMCSPAPHMLYHRTPCPLLVVTWPHTHALPCPPPAVPLHPLSCLQAGTAMREGGLIKFSACSLRTSPKVQQQGRGQTFGMCDCGYLFPPMLLPYAGMGCPRAGASAGGDGPPGAWGAPD